MNFDKYAKALAEHLDESIEGLGMNKQSVQRPVQPRPSLRIHNPEPAIDTHSIRQSHKTQSSLFPGSHPDLARWED